MYQLAQELALEIDRILGESVMSASTADQLRRTVQSVLLNIAEGAGHFSPGRKIYYYHIARGAAAEGIAILTHLDRRRPAAKLRSARRTANMICVLLTGLIHAQEQRRSSKTKRSKPPNPHPPPES